MKVKIIGFGVVGKNMKKIFRDATIHDPGIGLTDKSKCDMAIICVPTDMNPDGSANVSIVEKAIREHDADVFLIKSTIPPFTTDNLIAATGKKIVFSPEYFGGTEHANYHNYDFIILGGYSDSRQQVIEIYKKYIHPETKIIQTDSETAEFIKYMENCWLAYKVTFCTEFARVAERIGLDYNELRELFLLDPRVNRSHTFVYKDKPFYDSHCLNKDIPAFIAWADKTGINVDFLKYMHKINEAKK